MTASDIVKKYISFFEERGHKRITNSPLVPINDPTTLFTSSGMQALVPYLLGEQHSQGTRLVNVQNCFRAQDIEEVGDNRHTTFFRMLGNWSLGDYFKKEQLPWFWEFLTKKLGLPPEKLYVTVFEGSKDAPQDTESAEIWTKILKDAGLDPKERIHYYGVDKNWWSRSGIPEKMPVGEPGGPDSEVFYEFTSVEHDPKYGEKCHPNCECGRFMEIGNSVFMQYIKQADGSFKGLPKQNVDFGGGLERFITAVENQPDIFQTTLLSPIIRIIEQTTNQVYTNHAREMRIIADHFIAAMFIISANVTPSKTEHGYILRRLIRRSLDNFYKLNGDTLEPIIKTIIEQYKETDPELDVNFERIKSTMLEEANNYLVTVEKAKKIITKTQTISGKAHIVKEISVDDAFKMYATHGLSPEQIKNLGYTFNEQEFAKKMEDHKNLSRSGAEKKFRGGLADHSERTIMGHTATHLLHQALRDVLGKQVHQTGSNITTERVRFDFNYDKRLTDEEMKKVEDIINEKIKDNLPVHFELIPTEEAYKLGAIGLFMDTYGDKSKIYFIGDTTASLRDAYSIEFCGGPHVDFTGKLKSVKIVKQENLGKNQKRIYARVE